MNYAVVCDAFAFCFQLPSHKTGWNGWEYVRYAWPQWRKCVPSSAGLKGPRVSRPLFVAAQEMCCVCSEASPYRVVFIIRDKKLL